MNELNSTTEELEKKIKLPEKLILLRQKLNDKARKEPNFKFYALYDRIYREDTLLAAWQLVLLNKGAAGVDKVEFDDIISPENGGVQKFLQDLREELRTKIYQPQAVKRVYIPKANGKMRPLGIPTIRDRVVQMATLLIIEPIFEADFLECSYGFRPKKSAHQAMSKIRENLKQGFTSVYDADLKGYFDSIPHDKLMKCLEMRISDRSVLKLIRSWLKVPIVENENGKEKWTKTGGKGTPQGGVISPLLANLYLHYFDKVFHGNKGASVWANAKLVRYADDFVVMARYQSGKLTNWIESKLEGWLGLEINREKTKIVNLNKPRERLDFLGYSFRYDLSFLHSDGSMYLNVFPSKKSVESEKVKLREILSKKNNCKPISILAKEVNRQLSGWSNYFSFGYPKMAYRKINWFLDNRIHIHLNKRSQKGFKYPKDRSRYVFKKELGFQFL